MIRFIEKRKELIRYFFSRSFGIVGVALLVFFIVMAASAPLVAGEALGKWSNVEAWQDNPKVVPPVWYLRLINAPTFPTTVLEANEFSTIALPGFHYANASIEFRNDNDGLPTGFVFYVTYSYSSKFVTNILIQRPDGTNITIDLSTISFSQATNVSTFTLRIPNDAEYVKLSIYNWLRGKVENLPLTHTALITTHILFAELNEKILYPSTASPLRGTYKLIVTAISGKEIEIKQFKLIIKGNAHGVMGTDGYNRDVWSALLWGAPIAFLIGLLTSLISLVLGLVYGTVSGYHGGRLDEILMRIVDVLLAIPVLPILILFLAYFGRTASIWILIFLISIFGWMGVARVARSNTLQIKEAPFIEAVKVAGAGSAWIMFRHIMPQMMPYAYASLALGVPGAILTEAGLSFLGLGDPTLPTWGQILNHAGYIAAVQFGYWWLWVPPGLLIAGISIAFIFIGHAIDEVLNPRIRRL